MTQIWKNAMIYNKENTHVYLMAKELKNVFETETEIIPKTEDDIFF
jgi:hypothetical protein